MVQADIQTALTNNQEEQAMKREREKVAAILEYYRDIDSMIKLNGQIIKNLEDRYYTTLGAVNVDGMPHGKGGVSSPVERAVLNIPRSVTLQIEELRRENDRQEKLKAAITSELNGLNYREKAVIQRFYIEGVKWEQVSAQINYSERQCRNIRNCALDRLAKRFSTNKTISKFRFPEK